jgi:chorismate synthase
MVEIRTLRDCADFLAIPAIEKSAWGFDDLHIEPHNLMTRVQKYGGLVQGLFLDGSLIGFSYALLGKWQGRYFLFSHMTAVHRDHAGRGYGYQLKQAQRREALAMGHDTIRWMFDPLEALNSHFNIHRLGAVSREYECNIYGMGDSGLHKGLATDRLVAEWELNSARVQACAATPTPTVTRDIPPAELHAFTAPTAFIEIPRDIRAVKLRDMSAAIAWRAQTGGHFAAAFASGYVAEDIVRDRSGERLFYQLRCP